MLDPTNDIRVRVMGSSHGSVIVREGLLRFNNAAALLTWTAVRCRSAVQQPKTVRTVI
jgi:hypothetical protein